MTSFLVFKNINGFSELVALIGLFISYYFLRRKRKLLVTILCLTVCLLLFLNSRAGLLSFVFPFFIFIIPNKKIFFFVFLLPTLFFYKTDSALGRMLIWKVCLTQSEPSLLGHGINSFERDYPSLQSKYFIYNNDEKEIMIADDSRYAFNETIQIYYEFGIIGFCLFLVLVFYLFFKSVNRKNKLFILLVTSLLINSLFYYTFHEYLLFSIFILSVLQILLPIIGIVNAKKKTKYFILSTFIFLSILPFYFLYQESEENFRISLFETKAFQGDFSFITQIDNFNYNNYNRFRKIKLICTGYLYLKDTVKAISVLENYKFLYRGYDLLILLGKNYMSSKIFVKARENLWDASKTIPNRFEPLFLIMQSYLMENNKDSAKSIANIILNKKVKISNGMIKYYTENAQKVINQ